MQRTGMIILVNAFVWAVVILATTAVLRGTPYFQKTLLIMGGGAAASLILLGGVLRRR